MKLLNDLNKTEPKLREKTTTASKSNIFPNLNNMAAAVSPFKTIKSNNFNIYENLYGIQKPASQ